MDGNDAIVKASIGSYTVTGNTIDLGAFAGAVVVVVVDVGDDVAGVEFVGGVVDWKAAVGANVLDCGHYRAAVGYQPTYAAAGT